MAGADAQKITAKLIPQEALKGNGDGSFEFNWNVKNSAVKVENGAVSVIRRHSGSRRG